MKLTTTANRRPIAILVYHQIAPAPPKGTPFRSLCVSSAAFARQMAMLRMLGYTGLSMTALQPYLRGERDGKVFGITFDDGYQNNLTNALPVLQRNRFSSTCYAVSGLMGQTNVWDREIGVPQTPLMTADELRQWVAGGQEVGSHTDQHVNLIEVGDSAAEADMQRGKAALESVLGLPVTQFCYPYGRYESRHRAMVDALGFATATTTARSRCLPGMDMLELPRVPVHRSTSLPVLWMKVASAYEDRHDEPSRI